MAKKKKRCRYGRNKNTGNCLKHPRKKSGRKTAKKSASKGRKGNCAKWGRSERTGKCRKGPARTKTATWDPSQPIRWGLDGFR